jgi:hpaII restriction endonuclease
LTYGKIYAVDSELNKPEDDYFPIIRVIREETKGEIKEYTAGEIVSIYINGSKVKELHAAEFESESVNLLNEINSKDSKYAFSVESTQNCVDRILCYKIFTPAIDKTDIMVKIIDADTVYSPTIGSSMKSELGSYSTLLKAGKTTNFIYRIVQNQSDLVREANGIYKVTGEKNHTDVRGRINKIIKENGTLEYRKMNGQIFEDNLVLIDSNMGKIIAETLLYFYKDGISNCNEMVEKLEQENPLNYGNVNAYRYKFKKFLTAVALGMKPATVWDGLDEATGGYIVVTKEGNVLAYHIYNRNYFEEYLLNNTKYEIASTSRNDFGEVYSENGEDFIKLNLQVRFI